MRKLPWERLSVADGRPAGHLGDPGHAAVGESIRPDLAVTGLTSPVRALLEWHTTRAGRRGPA